MGDVQKCEGDLQCPSDGRYQFNTNVVFETNGALIAKYHKQNLYSGENNYFDAGAPSSNCISFHTSFGVTFGTFTCFDLLYNEPGDCLLKKGVKNFVLPTAWGNNFPFYVSIGVQQSWSLKHSINFLAANQHLNTDSPKYYSSGSGIYSSGNANYFISSYSPSESVRHVIISEVPSIPTPSTSFQHSGTVLNADNILMKGSKYLKFIPLENTDDVIQVSMNENKMLSRSLKCTLEYSIKSAGSNELYALGVYIGVRHDDDSFGYAVCSLVRCNTDLTSCGSPVDRHTTDTVFEKLILNGTFPATSTVYATAFQSGLKLFNSVGISVGDNNLVISDNTQPLLSASLWARVELKNSKAMIRGATVGILIILLLLIINNCYCVVTVVMPTPKRFPQ